MIEVGDWVVVNKATPCCGYTGGLGMIYQVVHTEGFLCTCSICKLSHGIIPLAWREPGFAFDVRRLTKIDPLNEMETEREEITA